MIYGKIGKDSSSKPKKKCYSADARLPEPPGH